MNAPLEVARTLSLLRRKEFLGFANELLGLLVFSLSHKPFREFRASLRLVLIAVHLVRLRESKSYSLYYSVTVTEQKWFNRSRRV